MLFIQILWTWSFEYLRLWWSIFEGKLVNPILKNTFLVSTWKHTFSVLYSEIHVFVETSHCKHKYKFEEKTLYHDLFFYCFECLNVFSCVWLNKSCFLHSSFANVCKIAIGWHVALQMPNIVFIRVRLAWIIELIIYRI